MFKDSVTPEIRDGVNRILGEDQSAMPGRIATTLGIPEAVAVAALPETMQTFVDPDLFDAIWEAMMKWERVTFIRQTETAVIEVKGKLPKGKHGHGYFNLMEKGNPLGGHLLVAALGGICFLEKPFFGLESLSVQFYDKDGVHMFAIYAGREKKAIIPSVKEGFYATRSACVSS